MGVGRETAHVTSMDAANPAEVGADRIANATAAAAVYGSPSIVVDFGTATNLDVVNAEGAYVGGCIAPGIRVSLDALTARAARLARVPLEAPERTIGRSTVEAVQSGTVVGAAAMAEGLVARIKRELGAPEAREAVQSGTVVGAAAMAEGLVARIKRELGAPEARVIATGGLAGVVAEATDVFDAVDPQLTIKGICEIHRRLG